MQTFKGYLFAKLAHIHTDSEGPAYYLQQVDYEEVLVKKKVELWMEDPVLHPNLWRKVEIRGVPGPEGMEYESVTIDETP